VRTGMRVLQITFSALFLMLATVLLLVWRVPAAGDISQALVQHPDLYTLSLGHLGDLTLTAFAYLRLPLALAALAFGIAAIGLAVLRRKRAQITVIAVAMILFFHAARVALIRFDPYLGSYSLAQALQNGPPGKLIENDAYWSFTSVFFYANRDALLLDGRQTNLEYGSYAPGAPNVFIDDHQFQSLWSQPERWYLVTYGSDLAHLTELVGQSRLTVVARSADNYLLTNLPLH